MFDAFTDKPTFTPYRVRTNTLPLVTMTPLVSAAARRSGTAAAAPTTQQLAAVWQSWAAGQNFSTQDMVNMAQLNRAIWYASHHYVRPYPGDPTVLAPAQVPGGGKPQPSGD